MMRTILILPIITISLLIACNKSSSDDESGYSVNQGITNPYAAVTQSNFDITYGPVTYTPSTAEKHYAIAFSNGSSAGVACAAYESSGKELFKLTFSVPSTTPLPVNVGEYVNYSSSAGTVIARYTPDGSNAPSTTHSNNAMRMARNNSATINFTVTRTSAGYTIQVSSISDPDASYSLTVNNSSTFTAVVAE